MGISVAYLAFVMRYTKGWLLQNQSSLFRRRYAKWFVNIGMPTESYDDPSIAKPYRYVGTAAVLLARSNIAITIESTRRALVSHDVRRTVESNEVVNTLGIAVVPEAAAEMTGFAKSTRGAPGLYLLVDVGALTLDACMFRLNQSPSGDDTYAFMAASVRPLGVDSLSWFIGEGKSERDFIKQCERTLRSVVGMTKRIRDPNADVWKPGNDVPVFFAGGGSANPLHQDVLKAMGLSLSKHTGNDGIRLLELTIPDSIELPESLVDFRRMAVDWRLIYPRLDIGKIWPMQDIEDIQPPKVVDLGDRYISKDQT